MGNNVQYQRITEALDSYWREKKQDRPFANESDISPEDFGELWDHCFLLRVEKGNDFHYTYMGSALIEAYGDDMTGHEVCEHIMGNAAHPMLKKFREVVTNKSKVLDENEFKNSHNMNVRYRSILLPLSNGGDHVAYILGGMKWKAY